MAESTVFRPGGVSYLRIPAPDPQRAATFYAAVFGWTVDNDRMSPSFADGSGHVIGHFMADLPVAGTPGVRPYVYVEDVPRRSTARSRTAPSPRPPPTPRAT